jgi:hypothetical protein
VKKIQRISDETKRFAAEKEKENNDLKQKIKKYEETVRELKAEIKSTKVSEREYKDLKEKTERYQQTIKQLKAENE